MSHKPSHECYNTFLRFFSMCHPLITVTVRSNCIAVTPPPPAHTQFSLLQQRCENRRIQFLLSVYLGTTQAFFLYISFVLWVPAPHCNLVSRPKDFVGKYCLHFQCNTTLIIQVPCIFSRTRLKSSFRNAF